MSEQWLADREGSTELPISAGNSHKLAVTGASETKELSRTLTNRRVLVWIKGPYDAPTYTAKLPADEGYPDEAMACEGVGATNAEALADLEAQLEAL
jgi:hypothetical protein